MNISFDANEVKIVSRTAKTITVDIETDYPDKILEGFSTDEIIKYCPDLDELYQSIMEYFGYD